MLEQLRQFSREGAFEKKPGAGERVSQRRWGAELVFQAEGTAVERHEAREQTQGVQGSVEGQQGQTEQGRQRQDKTLERSRVSLKHNCRLRGKI